MKHKIAEILVEIAIIVFAITLSLFLERWRENVEDHHIEKKFLQGLQTDLETDLKELKSANVRCNSMKQAAQYFLQPEEKINWSADSVHLYAGQLFHNVYFFPNTNRYESLKSTGKLGVIENEELQSSIIDLYQTKIPDLMQQIGYFNDFLNNRVRDYLINNFERDPQNQVLLEKPFFSNVRTRNTLMFYGDLDDVTRRTDAATQAIENILTIIRK